MATIKFLEPIIDATIATLQAELPAHVATFNAEPGHAAPLALTAPANTSYVFGATDAMTVFPLVEVSVQDGRVGDASLADPDGAGRIADNYARLTIVVWLQGVTGEVPDVYRQALGYTRLLIEILTVDGALGPDAQVDLTREDAIEYRFAVIPSDPADVDREVRKWKVPAMVSLAVEAVEVWTP